MKVICNYADKCRMRFISTCGAMQPHEPEKTECGKCRVHTQAQCVPVKEKKIVYKCNVCGKDLKGHEAENVRCGDCEIPF